MWRLFSFFALIVVATPALANGVPEPWQMGFQEAATPVMEDINTFHNYLLVLITLITLFVLGLMVWCFVRFNSSANPQASRTSHNTQLEFIWTLIPCIILFVMAIPSYQLLKKETHTPPDAALTIKATGHQWYWEYEYSDGEFSFTANMIADEDIQPGQLRLLSTDNPVVVPVGKAVRVLVTASDVLHAFAVPAFGVKMDAVPGRINETWFRATKPGTYYGQCSELCGTRHAFMPIEVHVVSEEDYQRWLNVMRSEYGAVPAKATPQG